MAFSRKILKKFFVDNNAGPVKAKQVARALGMSELVIGLTIVAAGTSLPEVATSVIAAARRERDIAVGNVIGSNLFNILVALGLAAVLVPGGVEVAPAALRFDIPVMLAVAVACLPIFFTGHLIARWEWGLFLGYYLAYTLYLILRKIFSQRLGYQLHAGAGLRRHPDAYDTTRLIAFNGWLNIHAINFVHNLDARHIISLNFPEHGFHSVNIVLPHIIRRINHMQQ